MLQDPIVKIARGWVEEVSTKVTPIIQANDAAITGSPSLITSVYYQHGHILEIIETLKQRDQGGKELEKYPLVALLQDFPLKRGQLGIEGETTLHFIIAMSTLPEYKADQRQARNFDPILYPIYEAFLKAIAASPFTMEYSVSKISHTQIDRMYWGRDGLAGVEGNIFDDWIDCIELKDLSLKINRKVC